MKGKCKDCRFFQPVDTLYRCGDCLWVPQEPAAFWVDGPPIVSDGDGKECLAWEPKNDQ